MASRILTANRSVSLREALFSDTFMLVYMSLIVLLGHLVTNGQYGYQRDEFYYVTCGRHLAPGFVDHPPLTPMMANFSLWLFGNSLFGLRFFPAVAGSLVVLFTGLIAREIGGNRFCQLASAIAVMTAPLYLAANGLMWPISFDQLIWTLCSYFMVRIFKTGDQKTWTLIGLTVGIGLLNKYNVLFYVFGLLTGMIISGPRRHFKSIWFWLGVGIATLINLPNVVWQFQHHFATAEFLHNLNQNVMSHIPRQEFLFDQFKLINPLTFQIWFAGLLYFFKTEDGKIYRPLGWIYLVILTVLLITQGRNYYMGGIYPTLMAAGPIALFQFFRNKPCARIKMSITGMIAAASFVAFPMAVPSLRDQFSKDDKEFAELVGWDELIDKVSDVYYSKLTAEERKKVTILTENYGEAGAVDLLGANHGLPRAISGHNNYYLWGPGEATGEVCITLGYPEATLEKYFKHVEFAGVITNRSGRKNIEYDKPIFICKQSKKPLSQIWHEFKHYD